MSQYLPTAQALSLWHMHKARAGHTPNAPELVDLTNDWRARIDRNDFAAPWQHSICPHPFLRATRLARLATHEVAAAVSTLPVEAGGARAHSANEALGDELQAHVLLGRRATRVAARRSLASRVDSWLLHKKAEAGSGLVAGLRL